MSYWQRGTQIHWTYLGRRHGIHNVRPMTVVEHDADRLVAWLAGGTPLVKPVLADGREVRDAGGARDRFAPEFTQYESDITRVVKEEVAKVRE